MASPRPRKTAQQQINATLRRQYVFSLRCTGASYSTIFEATKRRFGATLPKSYNRRHVYNDVMLELTMVREELARDVEAVRALELNRLDQMQLAIWPLAVGRPANLEQGLPAIAPDLDAQRQVLAIQARRAKYLPGLDVPVKVAPTTPDGAAPWEGTTGLAALLEMAHQQMNGHAPLVPIALEDNE